ncbi:ribonuclease-3 [Methanolinea mesophila]|uniref:ribonuclease III domain-containing protein n=1 Tax=Methanolinea mesophila TaxID=547055 RepID=UPI001AE8D328|nr:ribonuclease III domain-containing protein [Methanolinea mesophila]MBP1928506.1 ribonuclease-3 [Methanolinea mesophila]
MTIEDLLGYFFYDREVLDRSLTRPVDKRILCDQQVPGLIGNAVLSAVLLDLLYRDGIDDAARLARTRDSIMKREILAAVAEQLSIWSFIRERPDEIEPAGEIKSAILADTLLAIIGGVFIDGGYEAAEQRIKRWFSEYLP